MTVILNKIKKIIRNENLMCQAFYGVSVLIIGISVVVGVAGLDVTFGLSNNENWSGFGLT